MSPYLCLRDKTPLLESDAFRIASCPACGAEYAEALLAEYSVGEWHELAGLGRVKTRDGWIISADLSTDPITFRTECGLGHENNGCVVDITIGDRSGRIDLHRLEVVE